MRAHGRGVRVGRAAASTLAALVAITATSAPSASAADPGPVGGGHWASVVDAAIHPGVLTLTGDAQCTANFVYTAAGHTYLGQAAHCSGTGAATDTNGCSSKSLPLGTPVQILGTGVTGRLAYNSWLSMQQSPDKNPDACRWNDLALIEIPTAAVSSMNPSVPGFGGPNGLNTTGTRAGQSVESYGPSPLPRAVARFAPKAGTSIGDDGHGWTHTVYTVTPGIPGDSGSAFLDSQGRALGDLSTLSLTPTPMSNHVSDLAHELSWARTHTALHDLRLVAGTSPFDPTAGLVNSSG